MATFRVCFGWRGWREVFFYKMHINPSHKYYSTGAIFVFTISILQVTPFFLLGIRACTTLYDRLDHFGTLIQQELDTHQTRYTERLRMPRIGADV
jgi:hypothetical protein